MQEGGSSVIELGIPYTDPQADGATIQKTNQIAISSGTTNISQCLGMIQDAQRMGLRIPVLLMGYYNPFLQFGLDKVCEEAAGAGVDGLIIVDLPLEEAAELSAACHKHKLSNIPLIAPTASNERIALLAEHATTFLYCVSVTGVTGARSALPKDLPDFVERVRSKTKLPLVVGFGISNAKMVQGVANISDGVVVGSAIVHAIEGAGLDATTEQKAEAVRAKISDMCNGLKQTEGAKNQATVLGILPPQTIVRTKNRFDETHFGQFGGQFIPGILSEAFCAIEDVYNQIIKDPTFLAELEMYRKDFVGGPTPLHLAKRLTKHCRGAKIWLKREDLAHTGAHKINNAIGQALLAKRFGKTRIIAETGAGQHGVATATICAKLDLDCTVYMGAVDYERQKLNVLRMKTLGAKVVAVQSGSCTLKDAINQAMRDLVTNINDTYYLIGSALGPHPFPQIVRNFQRVIGLEIRDQMVEKAGKLPDTVIACVGGGSNAIGAFHPFIDCKGVELHGVEAAGHGIDSDQGHSAALTRGTPGVFQGSLTYIVQGPSGQTLDTHSISAGLDYPAVGPEHAYLKDIGRATYSAVTDDQALEGFKMLCEYEGIIPALETSHAIYHAIELAKTLGPEKDIVINVSGRGDKDMPQIARIMGVEV